MRTTCAYLGTSYLMSTMSGACSSESIRLLSLRRSWSVFRLSNIMSFPKSQTSNLDKLSFAKYMKNIGRAYRKQAMELVSTCRTFVQAGDRSISQDADLRKWVPVLNLICCSNRFERVLAVVDVALSSAADPKTSVKPDQMFEGAIQELSDYEQKYHPK